MRCFIAIDIPEALKPRIIGLQEQFSGYNTKLVESQNLHFTLKFLGETDLVGLEDRLEFISRTPSFEIELAGMGCFPSENFVRSIWIGIRHNQKLINLQESVSKALGLGEEVFTPHLTIARLRSQKHKNGIIDIIKNNSGIEIGTMKLTCVKLKESKLSPEGPAYRDVRTFGMI
ncbi:MAG: RNA 2',3'-cyclic phosphodiesterase [Candidatus Aenigmarchaeota archaeon]|nr:RNA 2',3'-cyclic phosphodiesterase [Candidatus Aenigmarchaeota archaeon]